MIYSLYRMTHTLWVIWAYNYSSIFLHGRLFGLEATVRSETFWDSSNDSEYHKYKEYHCDVI